MLTPEQLDEAFEYFKQQEKKLRAMRRAQINAAQKIKKNMSVEEKIELVNTAYKDIPPELKPGMTKHPQCFNSVHMTHPKLDGQHETFAARLIRFRDKYDLDIDTFINLCNEYAEKMDKPARKGSGRKVQRTRITSRDIMNYEDFNVSPKVDKMTVISKAMGLPISYLAGYGEQDRATNNQILEAKYRKKPNKKNYKKYTEGKDDDDDEAVACPV